MKVVILIVKEGLKDYIHCKVMDKVGISCYFQNCQTVFFPPNLMSANEFKEAILPISLEQLKKSTFIFKGQKLRNDLLTSALDRG